MPDVFSSSFAYDIFMQKYSMDGKEGWVDTCKRVVTHVVGDKLPPDIRDGILQAMISRKFIPAGRYLYAAGRDFHQVNNCYTLRAEDSREGWGRLLHDASQMLMTGGGIGVDYSAVRAEGECISRTGGFATGPLSLMKMLDQVGHGIMQGGARRSAIWGGLSWKHADVLKFITSKDHSTDLKKLKEKDYSFHLPLEGTNISVIYDTEFFSAIEDRSHPLHEQAKAVWKENAYHAFTSAEPGWSFNYLKDNESLRNACTELVSSDDSDKCNLGTVWMNRCVDVDDFATTVALGTFFLLCGAIYTDYPTGKAKEVGQRNNRLGLGLGGMSEWLIQRRMPYEVTAEMKAWLSIYKETSDATAEYGAEQLGVSKPIGVRAIAPNGTLGIIAETSSGIEPIFAKAYKRRYLKGNKWLTQYVVDGAAKRLIDNGVPAECIFDAYDLSFEQRIRFQYHVQQYVDQAISSTCNIAEWGSETNNLTNVQDKADILLKYAKGLRGFTVFPDGCRGGQPLTKVDINTALAKEGVEIEEKVRECTNGVCGL